MAIEVGGNGFEAKNGVAQPTLSRQQTTKRLARSYAQVRGLERAGRLTPLKVDGAVHYARAEVASLSDELQAEGENDSDRTELAIKTGAVGDLVAISVAHSEAAFGLLLKGVGATQAHASQTMQALLAENRRLTERDASRETEMATLREEHRKYLDNLAEQARADRAADLQLEQRRLLLESGRDALKSLSPALPAILSRVIGAELPDPVKVAGVGAILEQLPPDKREALIAAVVQSGALSNDQLASLALLLAPTKNQKAEAGPPAPSATLEDRAVYWNAFLDRVASGAERDVEVAERNLAALAAERAARASS